jgi:hypothetical protein
LLADTWIEEVISFVIRLQKITIFPSGINEKYFVSNCTHQKSIAQDKVFEIFYPKDFRTSFDSYLAGSFAAIQRTARSAQDLAIKTDTSIFVFLDGIDVIQDFKTVYF